MHGPAFLAGDRVTLRTVAEEDHHLFERAHNDPAFRDGLLFRTPRTRADVEEFVEERTSDGNVLLVVYVDEPHRRRQRRRRPGRATPTPSGPSRCPT